MKCIHQEGYGFICVVIGTILSFLEDFLSSHGCLQTKWSLTWSSGDKLSWQWCTRDGNISVLFGLCSEITQAPFLWIQLLLVYNLTQLPHNKESSVLTNLQHHFPEDGRFFLPFFFVCFTLYPSFLPKVQENLDNHSHFHSFPVISLRKGKKGANMMCAWWHNHKCSVCISRDCDTAI